MRNARSYYNALIAKLTVFARWAKSKFANQNTLIGIGFICLLACVIVGVVIGVLGLISLPFAFIGWMVITACGVFISGLETTYLTCVATGFVIGIVFGVIKQ